MNVGALFLAWASELLRTKLWLVGIRFQVDLPTSAKGLYITIETIPHDEKGNRNPRGSMPTFWNRSIGLGSIRVCFSMLQKASIGQVYDEGVVGYLLVLLLLRSLLVWRRA